MSSSKLKINALSAVAQVTVSALIYFFLYRFLLKKLGVDQLGIWSLILSFSSIANLANLGLTSGLVKFVAEYLIDKDQSKVGKLIWTSVISLTVLFTVLSIIILFFAEYFLKFVIDAKYIATSLQILPFSLISLCINAVGGVFTSVLEGSQKNYIRNFIYVIGGVMMYIFTLILVPQYNLKGVAFAQVIQSSFVIFAAFFYTLKINSNNSIGHWKWSWVSFRELFGYGYKFQVVSICQLLYEPATKLLLSRFGGLALLGHYEMATKAVSQIRALMTNANQVIVPVVAEKAKEGNSLFLQSFYIRMNRLLLLISLPFTTALIIFSPFISFIWIGDFNRDFIFSMIVLLVANFINVMCGPAYFSSLGEGRLKILVWVHLGMAILNILLGILASKVFGGYGGILGWAIALSAGSVMVSLSYRKMIKLKFQEVFTYSEKNILYVSLLVISIGFLSFYYIPGNYLLLKFSLTASLVFLYLPVITRNSQFKEVLSSVKKR